MKKHLILFLCILLFFPSFLSAGDFGLILDQTPGFTGVGSDVNFDYTGMLIPRFSTLIGERGSLYASAGLRLEYENETTTFVPELLRTEFSWRFNSGNLMIGRMPYTDQLGFIADGLFDGARLSLDAKAGTFSVGAWYTGLLYKKRTNITMTMDEMNSYNSDVDYGDFADTYFAPARILAALEWEHPAVGDLFRIKAGVLGQFDVSGSGLHSQYLTAKISAPAGNFIFSLGGCLEFIQNTDADETGFGLAGELGLSWMLPTAINDRLSFLGRFSSGVFDDSSMKAFLPVSTSYQGDVLKAKLSGLSMLSLEYFARLHRNFSLGLKSSYFILSDLGSYPNYNADGYFLGNEFFGRFIWSPASDVLFNLGAGVFLPSMGNTAPNEDPRWRIELNLVLMLY